MIITGRNEKRLNDTYESLSGNGHKQMIANLIDDESINLLSAKIENLNAIVHSAGIVNPKPFNFITREGLDQILNINFVGPYPPDYSMFNSQAGVGMDYERLLEFQILRE